MSQHTPGPWTYKRGEGRYASAHYIESHVYSTPTVISGKDQIAQCHGYEDEVVANARLIAAAPDMLAALKSARDSFDQFVRLNRIPANTQGRRDVLAAIAKAEG